MQKMKKIIPYLIALMFLLPFALSGCERSSESTAQMQPTNATLGIEEARAFFDSYVSSIATRTTADNPMPFVMGDYSIDWENAEESSLPHLSSVDVPTETEFVYFVGRYDANGELYTVRADSKIIIVKESDNDAIMTYVRTTIPDAFYADVFHDQNICDLTLNCDDRVDYWGLEYYSTLDGCPIAVAKYENGECVASVYLKDESRTIENRIAAFGRLMGNTWVIRRPAEQTRVTGDGNWNYGTPGSTFYGTDGTLYIYLDHNGDGKSDSITTWALYQEMYSNTDTSNGGGGGSNNQTPPYSPPDPFVPTNNGGDGNSGSEGHSNVSGGSNSGEGEGEGDPDNNQEGEQNPIVVDTLQKDTLPRDTLSNPTGPKLPAEEVNPLPAPKIEPEEEFCEECGFSISKCICPKEKDCDEIAPEASENSNATTSFFDTISNSEQYGHFIDSINRIPTIEWGMVGYNLNGIFEQTPPYTNGSKNKVGFKASDNAAADYLVMSHNHPGGSPFSPDDIIAQLRIFYHYTNFRNIYLISSDDTIYVAYVYDTLMAKRFLESGLLNSIKSLFEEKYRDLCLLKYTKTDAHLYALSYVLQTLQTGVAILSKKSNSNHFSQHMANMEYDEFGNLKKIELIKCIEQ